MIFLDAESRLAKKLLSLGELNRGSGKPPGQMKVPISQRELGTMIGLSRESINKQLAAWQKDGVIKIENGSIILLDADALRAYGE
jgi:CRP-like cAMP-binding protein